MTIHVDSLIVSALLGVVGIGLIWLVGRGATAGVPNKRQAFVELLFDFVDGQVRGIFHGDPNKFVAPAALTVFLWVLLMNATAFLPIDITAKAIHAVGPEEFRLTPTADVNTTFALALSVWLLMIWFSIKVKGLGGWIHELFCTPFGSQPPALALQFPVQPGRAGLQAALPRAAVVRQPLRRRNHLPAAAACGLLPGSSAPSAAPCWASAGRSSTC